MKHLFISIKITLAFVVVLALGYVFVLWGVAAVATPNSGQAQVVKVDNKIVGAVQVGQAFTQDKYFWSRPSSVDYDGGGSGGSNFGPTNPDHLAEVEDRIEAFLLKHPYLERSQVPSEMVTASGSGLDPHISPEGAAVQIQRVAEARGVEISQVETIVAEMTECPVVGSPFINVLILNVTLDEKLGN